MQVSREGEIDQSAFDRETVESQQSDPRFIFVPFAQQEGPIRRHTIDLTSAIQLPKESELPGYEGCRCEDCGSTLRAAKMEYSKTWGDTEQLSYVVRDVEVLACDCGQGKFFADKHLPLMTGWLISQRARSIREYLDFEEQEALEEIQQFLPPDDVAKVQDFSAAMRAHPWFVHPESNKLT